MHYLRFAVILTLFSLPAFAANPERKVTKPPKYGEFVGVKAKAYEVSGIKDHGIGRVNTHPGVVIGGPNEDGKYQVAMISKNLPHDPPSKPIKDFHPEATTYGNIDLTPPKDVNMDHMRIWLAEKTYKEEIPMSQQNLQKLKTAMIPNADWKPPKAPTPPPQPPQPPQRSSKKNSRGRGPWTGSRPPPAQGASSDHQYRHYSQGPRFKNAIPGPSAQGGSSAYPHPQGASSRHPLPPNPQYGSGYRGPHPPHGQGAIHSTGPAANVASSSKHMIASGSSHQEPQNWRKPGPPSSRRPNSPSKRPNSPSKRPNSPSKRPNSPSKKPGPSSRRPYPPPSRPHSPSGRSGSPTDRSRAQGPRTQTQHTGKGKGRAEGSPKRSRSPGPQTQAHSNSKGKGREGSPPKKSRFN